MDRAPARGYGWGMRTARLGAALLPLLVACVQPAPFDPSGDEVRLTGTWQLREGSDGPVHAPTGENCTRMGVAQVQLVLFGEFNQRFEGENFLFPCDAGSFDSGQALRHGVYWTQYQGVNAEGEVVGRSARGLVDVLFDEDMAVPTEGDADTIRVQLPDDDAGQVLADATTADGA
jgi:hypothetical protein